MFKNCFYLLFLILTLSFNAPAQVCGQVFSSKLSTLKNQSNINEQNIKFWKKMTLSGEKTEEYIGTNKEIKYTYLKTDQRKRFKESDLFKDGSDLIIGIDTEGYTKGHVYMIIDNVRTDGRLLFAQHTKQKEKWEISNGIFVRLKGLPEENKQKLYELIASEEVVRDLTCVAATCKIIFDYGGLNGPGKEFLFPSGLLKYVLDKNHNLSKNPNSLKFEIFTLNADAEYVLKNLPTWWNVFPRILQVYLDPKNW